MLEWFRTNGALLAWAGALSGVALLGSLLVIPFLVARLPADYFTQETRSPAPWLHDRPTLRAGLLVGKNTVGALLALSGIAMLVLPGQGILAILVGVGLMDFPGKFRLERWLVRRTPVLRALNWIRARAGQPAFEAPAGDPPANPR